MTMRRLLLIALLLSALLPGVSWAVVLAPVETCGGSGDMGANWTAVTGLDMPQQGSGVCQGKTISTNASAIYTAATWPNDQWAQMKITTLLTGTSRVVGVVLRGTTGAFTQYECIALGPTGAAATLKIQRVNAGTPTVVATTGAAATLAAGDTLYCEVIGSTLTLKVNGTTILGPTVDGTPIASGSAGMFIVSPTLNQAQGDDWTGGDFSTSSSSLGWMEADE